MLTHFCSVWRVSLNTPRLQRHWLCSHFEHWVGKTKALEPRWTTEFTGPAVHDAHRNRSLKAATKPIRPTSKGQFPSFLRMPHRRPFSFTALPDVAGGTFFPPLPPVVWNAQRIEPSRHAWDRLCLRIPLFYFCLSSSVSLNILTSVPRLVTQREAAAISLYYMLARQYAFGCIFSTPPSLPSHSPICLCADLITAALQAGRSERDYVRSQGNGCVTTLLRLAVTGVDERGCAAGGWGGMHTQGFVDAADGRKDEYWHQIVIILFFAFGANEERVYYWHLRYMEVRKYKYFVTILQIFRHLDFTWECIFLKAFTLPTHISEHICTFYSLHWKNTLVHFFLKVFRKIQIPLKWFDVFVSRAVEVWTRRARKLKKKLFHL